MKKPKILTALIVVIIALITAFGLTACKTVVNGDVVLIYELNGGDYIKSVIVNKGVEVELAKTATKEGYDFDGWYFTPDCSGERVTVVKLEVNTTVYAKWVKYPTLIYEVDGGTPVESLSAAKGTKIELAKTATKEGYDFDGWYLTSDYSGEAVTEITLNEDTVVYSKWQKIEKFNSVLVLERGEKPTSEDLAALLVEQGYVVTIVNVSDSEQADLVPETVDDLRVYDQVVLNNVSNSDLLNNSNVPDKFVENLYTYVHDFGGGLLTTGGQDDTGKNANAYRREDLYGTLLQSMLPVQAIEYTPPVAVMIIIDRSGSMASRDSEGFSCLKWAKDAAGEVINNSLTERDYAGIMTLDSYENFVVPLTPMTQKEVILSALREKIETSGGGTYFTQAIRTAANALKANKMVDRRHIVVISDGAMSDNKEALKTMLHDNYLSDKITLSVVGIYIAQKDADVMQELIDAAGGQESGVEGGRKVLAFSKENLGKLPGDLREELNSPQIRSSNEDKPFHINAYDKTSDIVKGITYITGEQTVNDPVTGQEVKVTVETSRINAPRLSRFYGTRVRSKDYLVLTGDYEVPLYARWNFGKGSVGSLTIDLQGSCGANAEFMNSTAGKTIIGNIVKDLMPKRSER